MIYLTPAAQEQIRSQITASGEENPHLRVAAKPDTRGSIEYAFGFDDPKDDDNVIEYEGFAVLVSPHSEDWLDGTTMDFVELESGEREFIFLNPNDPNYKEPRE